MKIQAEDFRRQYAGLNDDALLAIDREELIPLAQQCYDAELAARGLDAPAAEEEAPEDAPQTPHENLVELAVFDNPAEAVVARDLMRLAEIPCMLSTDLPLVGSVFNVASDVKLYVPAEFADQAQEVLESDISEEELTAQAEAAGLDEEEIEELGEEFSEDEARLEE